MANREFPEPGYYEFKSDPPDPEGIRRVYFITGTTKGNMWLDTEATEGEWWKLSWAAVMTVKESTSVKDEDDITMWYERSESSPAGIDPIEDDTST